MHIAPSLQRLLAIGLALVAAPACVAEEATGASTASASSEANGAEPSKGQPGEGLRLSVHTTLGIPEAARVDDPEHALLVKDEYVTSYDSRRRNPRWASWELTREWIGTADRTSSFRRDPDLSPSLPQATRSDFSLSGYQQGHLCPSADRTRSATVNAATFVFTNVVPQTTASNLGTWKTLENEERALVDEGQHVFVVAGTLFADDRTIGDGVAVPSSMFKVVVALAGAHPVPADVTASTRVIAVDIPNTNDVAGNYRNYETTIAELETRTGFRFLSDVDPAVHDALAGKAAPR